MNILAHRGLWTKDGEKNTLFALRNALKEGFGLETDIRDCEGKLVISHNAAEENSPLAEELFSIYKASGCDATLALNVKADGIQPLLTPLLEKYAIQNYFLFDMSVPEMVVNAENDLTFYTRHSDIERECVLYEKSVGVWMDSFYSDAWLTAEAIQKHLAAGKRVCLVSPELHGRPYQPFWKMFKDSHLEQCEYVSLCTDKPIEARGYFYGK